MRFKPDGSAFEQYSSRGGNTWGLDITWDGQVFWTQPTSGTVFFHTVLPESVLAKGRLTGTTSWKGMITGQTTYPRMSRPEQAYVQIDQVGQFTAAAGCAIYDGGAWPERWRYSYFTGEPTLNIVHHQFVKPEGVSYTTAKEPGREQTEFMRSGDMWFRPIETRVGPDGALYVVDFYNQAVIHNDTRGPQHGPANAAVRPDRDHYFGRIWRVQHKQATRLALPALNRADLPGLIRAIETNPNAQVRQTAWRLAQENHGCRRTPGAHQEADGEQRPGAVRAGARREDPGRAQGAPRHLRAVERQLDAVGHRRRGDRTGVRVRGQRVRSRASPGADRVRRARRARRVARERQPAARRRRGAGAPASVLKAPVVRAIARMEGGTIAMDAATTAALEKLLNDPATSAAALPIVAKWDKAGALSASADRQAAVLQRELADPKASDDRRAELAASLLAVPKSRAQALATIAPMLVDPAVSDSLKARVTTTLGESAGADVDAVMVAALARTPSTPIFDQILRRPDATMALLAAMKDGKVTPANLGPANVARLRTHPNRQVARQAAALLDTLSPAGRAKADIIASLTPEVEKPGDAVKGKDLFTGACSTCHKLGTLGKVEVGPPLNGMGAHGRAALLTHIIDPNREVDPSFWQWNVTTKKGETLTGVIAGENASGLTLRNTNGDVVVAKEDIATRENTRRSLMPEGLEALGPEALRDILTFIVANGSPTAAGSEDAQRFRIIDLREAYTADSRRGLRREDERDETVTLHRFGDVTVAGIPFFVMDPARSLSGANLIALKGGPGSGIIADEFPRRVEIPTAVTAASLHFLGGVGGWAWPTGGDAARGTPAMKVTVVFADGTTQEHVLKNGETFADTFGRAEVPLSTDAGDFTRRGQVRYFALNFGKRAALAKIVLESYDNDIVPVTVAITASSEPALRRPGSRVNPGSCGRTSAGPKEGGRGDAPLPRDQADRLGARQDEGPHHRRRQLAQLRPVLRRHRRRDAHRRRVQRQLHRGSRSGRGRDRQRRRGRHQRQPAVLRHARVPQGALRLRRGRQGTRDAAPGHVVRLRPVAGAERQDRRRRRPRPRPHRGVLGQRRQARASHHEGRAGVVHGRGRALLLERGSGEGSGGHLGDRSPGGNLTERQVHEAAPGGVDHEPPHGAHRRHHARPRPARARSRAIQDAARQRREVGGASEAVNPIVAAIGELESAVAGPVREQPQFVLGPKSPCHGSRRAAARTGAPRSRPPARGTSHLGTQCVRQSFLSATIGSTRAARWAGR